MNNPALVFWLVVINAFLSFPPVVFMAFVLLLIAARKIDKAREL